MADSSQQLLKILIGVAWIDGQVQDVERDYLLRIAQEQGLTDDPEISALLDGLGGVGVPPATCQAWIQEYLGEQPKPENYHQLLEALSAIVYSDNDVATAEAQLLMNLQQAAVSERESTLLSRLRTAYRQWVGG